MGGLLGIGLTGLFAAHTNLETTAHNLQNVNTPNYSRQKGVQTTQMPYYTGGYYVGQGTLMTTVKREFDQHLENRVLYAETRYTEFSSYDAQIEQINNMLTDNDTGLSTVFQSFFAGVQEVAANPTNIPARQSLISEGLSLIERFHSINTRLSEISQSIEGEMADCVESINSLGKEIADLNLMIKQADTGRGEANDLRDRRDHAIRELNKLIRVNPVVTEDGQIDVFIGNGQPLVQKNTSFELALVPGKDDLGRHDFAIVSGRGVQVELPEKLLTGGQLGGLISFRKEALDPTRDGINRIALQFALQFNEQHRSGNTLDGIMGQDFFDLKPVLSDGGPDPVPGFTILNDNLLNNDRFRVEYSDASTYTITRIADGKVMTPAEVGFEMDELDPSITTFPAAYIVAPLRNAAASIGMAINSPREVAAGCPVSVSAQLTNLGTGKVEDIRVLDETQLANAYPYFTGFDFTFDAATNTFTVNSATGYQFDSYTYDPTADSGGKKFTVLDAAGNEVFEFVFTGQPDNQATFTFAPTEEGVADNRNMVLLGTLQTNKTMLLDSNGTPTANFMSAYARIVSDAGNRGREAEVGMQAQKIQYEQALAARESVSGVNIDEEAANLLRFQLAYQASSRVLSTAQRLFDEIASIGR